MDGFKRILESGPQGRDEAVIMNAIIGGSSASSETGGVGTSHGIEMVRKKNDTGATSAGGIVVRKDIDQNVRQRVE